MAQTLRISLPTYNCLTDTNYDHYALYADSDNILIKEKTRGTVNGTGTFTINHNLGYPPFVIVFFDDGTYQTFCVGLNYLDPFVVYTTNNTLVMINTSGSSRTFTYYIFYDQQV